jgi:hypothetical protein
MNLRSAIAHTDPRSPEYEPTVYHLELIKKLLNRAASRYRDKYELSTKRIDDFQMGLQFLDALRRIHILFGEREDVEAIKRKRDIWLTKLESDIRRQKEEKAL